jgi:hypothetical protein
VLYQFDQHALATEGEVAVALWVTEAAMAPPPADAIAPYGAAAPSGHDRPLVLAGSMAGLLAKVLIALVMIGIFVVALLF